MKHTQRITAVFIFALLLMMSFSSLAQEGQSGQTAGITVTLGEWTLQFTGVTDDQDEIRKGQSGDRILVANPGYKIIRLTMDVPEECKRVNCDDLEITLTDTYGDEHGFSTRTYWSRLVDNKDTIYKIEYLIIVPDSMTFDGLTMSVAVLNQEEYTCTLAEVIAGEKAQDAKPDLEPVSPNSIPPYSGGDALPLADAVLQGLPVTVWWFDGDVLVGGPFKDWKIYTDEGGAYTGLSVCLVSPGSISSIQEFYDHALSSEWARGEDVSGEGYSGFSWTRGSQSFVAVLMENSPAYPPAGADKSILITYLLNRQDPPSKITPRV